jgi:bifunctional non-homologous end joining protein LigD
MLCDEGALPPDDDRWAFEAKSDGWRTIVYVDRGQLRLDTRKGRDITDKASELQGLGAALTRHRAILDGELVSPGEGGLPDFGALQGRLLGGGSSAPLALIVFDLLHLDGRSLMSLAYEERRAVLADLKLAGPSWSVTSYSVGNGAALLAASRELGIEGVVAKRLGSKYEPGRRSSSWRKVKNWDRRDFVIGGFIASESSVESLLLGEMVGGRLVYRGHLEYRLAGDIGEALALIAREANPFVIAGEKPPAGSRFVEPKLAAEVKCMPGDHGVRHGVVLSVRLR